MPDIFGSSERTRKMAYATCCPSDVSDVSFLLVVVWSLFVRFGFGAVRFLFSPFCVFPCLFFGSDFVVHLSLDLLMWRPFYYCMRSPFVAAFLAGRPPM